MRWWASTDGVAWTELLATGAVDAIPAWEGTAPDAVTLVRGTLVVLGRSGSDTLIWLARPDLATDPALAPMPTPTAAPGPDATPEASVAPAVATLASVAPAVATLAVGWPTNLVPDSGHRGSHHRLDP